MKKLALLMTLTLMILGLIPGMAALAEASDSPNPVITIEMEDGSVMKLELYPDVAGNTVSNFIELANSGFYDGLIFHRVISGFMIQGGDPTGTGMGGPGYSIKGEFSSNGVENELLHERGIISMARSQAPDSAGSQFFIMHDVAPHLDGQYAAFGKMIDDEAHWATLDAIAATPTDSSRPVTEQKIKAITVETFGQEYQAEKIEE